MKVLVLIFLTAFAFVQADQIKGTAILFRHGQRTPSLVLPNYGMTSQTQELGFGQLTLVRKLKPLILSSFHDPEFVFSSSRLAPSNSTNTELICVPVTRTSSPTLATSARTTCESQAAPFRVASSA